MLRRLINLPFAVASKAARAYQDRQDSRTKEQYQTVHDPGSLEMKAGPTAPIEGGDANSWTMDVVTVKALLSQKTPLEFVDVRGEKEFSEGHIEGATSMPLDTVGIRVLELPTDRMVVVVCEGGRQSLEATRFFRERGMEDTWVLAGGLSAWRRAEGPLVRNLKSLFLAIFSLSLLACVGRQGDMARQTAHQYVEEAQELADRVTTPTVACDAEVPHNEPHGCLSGVLHCGDVVLGTTEGGDSRWDDAFYAEKFCFPAGPGHSGPERVYSMDIPEYTQVTFELQTDCVDLDLVAISWAYDGSCPDERHAVFECDGANQKGWDKVLVQTFQKRSYIIGVDGKGDSAGTFKLTVNCQHILRPEEREQF